MAALFALVAYGYLNELATPLVRHAVVRLPHWPVSKPSVKLLLLSDTHVQGPDMPPSRLDRIVAQVNALQPDIIVAAGDFISDKVIGTRRYSMAEAIAPLGALHAPLGVFAVLGNHDHWRNAAKARAALADAHIKVLDNDAVEAGPIALGGVDDRYNNSSKLAKAVAKMRVLPGARVFVAHGPDEFTRLPADIPLMLAGHTHCGQIVLPFFGPIVSGSDYGNRYACGIIRENGRILIVSAGLGTSHVPLRFGAHPDMWLIQLAGSSTRQETK